MPASSRVAVVVRLGLAQTLAWASSYYLPAILAAPIANEFGLSTAVVFADFSIALVVSALVGPAAGHAIDRFGGRPLLLATNLVFAIGLAGLALATGPAGLLAGWLIVGIGMGSGLYEAAFAALVRLYGREARDPITGITLLAGFASTVGWPLSAWLEQRYGWRWACGGWALLHLLVGIPLNLSLPRAAAAAGTGAAAELEAKSVDGERAIEPKLAARVSVLLALTFAAVWFVATAMAAHLPGLLQMAGASLAAAIAASALVGPAQVAGRLLEFGVLRRIHPLLSARMAAACHPIGVVVLAVIGSAAAPLFAILHGAGHGILTIAKGNLPLVFFGPGAYGARQGWLMLPARIAQASAPLLFGLAIERWGTSAFWISGTVGLCALGALMLLPEVPLGARQRPQRTRSRATGS